MNNPTEHLTVQDTAERLGVTARRVQAMIAAGQIPAERFGRAYVIKESDLELVADRTPGRPPKAKDETPPETKPRRR